MSLIRLLFLSILVFSRISYLYSQPGEKADTILVNKLLSEADNYLSRNPDSTYYYATNYLQEINSPSYTIFLVNTYGLKIPWKLRFTV